MNLLLQVVGFLCGLCVLCGEKYRSVKGIMMNAIMVLGRGLASYTVVRELRKLNADIAITLVSRDSGDYYIQTDVVERVGAGEK